MWVGQGAQGPPAWAQGPGMLAFSGLLFPVPCEHGQRTGAGLVGDHCLSLQQQQKLETVHFPWTEQSFCLGAAGLAMRVMGVSVKCLSRCPEDGSHGSLAFQEGCGEGVVMLSGVESQTSPSGRWCLLAETLHFLDQGCGYHLLSFSALWAYWRPACAHRTRKHFL